MILNAPAQSKGAEIGNPNSVLGLPEQVNACLFDLDGVLTDTASLHAKAWAAMFDAYLQRRAEDGGPAFTPFTDADYQNHVDGKRRLDGVRSFLASRGITETDEAITELGEHKNEMFLTLLHQQGVEVFDGSRRYIRAAWAAGLAIAVVSSSANTREVLTTTGLDRYVAEVVDGVTMREHNIPGKPAPDSFLRAAQLLGADATAAAVFEDALAGVEAGRRGGFGFVVGVDRVGHATALRDNGADVVVNDLAELLGRR